MSDGIGVPGITDPVEVGRGGFAVVYRAIEPASSRTVAVKVLKGATDAGTLDRFQREVVAMGALGEHPAIVPLFRTGTTTEGQPYLVMPYFSAGSLQDELDRGRRCTWEEAARIGARLAGALQAAHDEGILHRDLKPANVLRNRYGDVLLSDFGIARIAGGTETTTGVVTASVAHAAPEVLDGARPSVASDVYGLASTVYALVQGRPAFVRDTDESLLPVISRVMTAPVPPLGSASAAFDAALTTGMAKRPEDRHPSAAALGAALAAALGDGAADGPGGSAPLDVPSSPVPAAAVDRSPPAGVPTAPPSPNDPSATVVVGAPRSAAATRSRRPFPLLIGAALLAVVLVGALVLRDGGADDPTASGGNVAAEEDVAADAEEAPEGGVAEDGLPEGIPLTGIGGQEVPEPDSVTEARSVEPGDRVEAALAGDSVLGIDVDLPGPGLLRVQTVSELDLVVTVRDEGDALIAGDDDSGLSQTGDALVDLPIAEAGRVQVLVNPLDGGTGPVEVRVDLVEIEAMSDAVSGELDGDGPPRAFQVDLDGDAVGAVRLRTESLDASLRLLLPDGVVAAESSGDADAGLSLRDLEGPHLLVVGLPPGDAGPFELVLLAADPVLDVLDGTDVEEEELPALDEVTREVEDVTAPQELAEGEVLAFVLVGAEAGAVGRAIVRAPDGLDTVMAVYGPDGALLGADDDGALSSESGLESMVDLAALPDGDLTVLVAALDRVSTGTVVLLAATSTPSPLEGGGEGEIGDADGFTAYALTAGPDGLSEVRVTGDVEVDLRLLTPQGDVILVIDEGGTPPLDLTEVEPGPYLLLVSAIEPGGFTIEVS